MNLTHKLFAAALFAVVAAPAAYAGPILAGSATYTYENTFYTRLYPGTPFNDTGANLDVPVFAQGTFTQEWEEQVGDSIQDELTSIYASGLIAGTIPFELFGGSDLAPELGPFTGSLTSIVNDPVTGELLSSFRVVGGAFRQELPGGVTLYTVDPYIFVASIDTLPFEPGDLFIGTTDVEIYAQAGAAIDPNTDPVIGIVLAGGVITITPEPASAILVGALAGALGVLGARRR